MKSMQRWLKVEILLDRVKRRHVSRNVGLSYLLVEEIEEVTKGCISTSSFVRMAVINELEKYKGKKETSCSKNG